MILVDQDHEPPVAELEVVAARGQARGQVGPASRLFEDWPQETPDERRGFAIQTPRKGRRLKACHHCLLHDLPRIFVV